METPNKLPTVGDSSVEKTLRDIEDGIFDLSVEVQEGFNKTCKYYNLFDSHLDNIHEYLYSIQTILEKSFSLSQTQQQENQLALMRAKAEEPKKEKEKIKEEKKPKPVELVEGLGIIATIFSGLAIGSLIAVATRYFLEKLLIPLYLPFRVFGVKIEKIEDFTNALRTLAGNTKNVLIRMMRGIKSVATFLSEGVRDLAIMFRDGFFKKILPSFLFSNKDKKSVENVKKGVDNTKTFLTRLSNFFFEKSPLKALDDYATYMTRVFRLLLKRYGVSVNFINKDLPQSTKFIKSFRTIFKTVSKFLNIFQTSIEVGFRSMSKFLKFLKIPFLSQIVDFAVGIYKGIRDDLGFFGILFSGIKEMVAGLFGSTFDVVIDMLDWVLSKFGFEGFEKKLFGIFGLDKDFSLADSIRNALQTIVDYFSDWWDGEVDFIADVLAVFDGFGIMFGDFLDFFKESFPTLYKILDFGFEIFKLVRRTLFAAFDFITGFFEDWDEDKGIVERVKTAFNKMISSFTTNILNLVDKFFKMFSVDNMKSLVVSGLGGPDSVGMKIASYIPGFEEFFKVSKETKPEIAPEKLKVRRELLPQFTEALTSNDFDKSKSIISQLKDSGYERVKMLEQRLLEQQSKFAKQSETLNITQNKNNEMKDMKNQSQPQVVTDQSVKQVNNNSRSTTVYQTQKDEEPLPRSMGGYLQPSM